MLKSSPRVVLFLATLVFYLVIVSLSIVYRIPSGPVVSVVVVGAAVWAFPLWAGVAVLVLELGVRAILYGAGILPPGVPTALVLMPMIFTDTSMLLAVAALRRSEDRQAAAEKRLREKNSDLEAALAEVTELRGMLPICAWCKCIREVDGMWSKLESYLAKHSRATLTHGICPQCAAKMEQEMQGAR
jgi:hypothetical protein